MHPGKIQDRVGFAIAVAQADAGVLRVVVSVGARRCAVLKVTGKGIVGDLVEVFAQRGDQAKLVRGIDVEDERSEAAVAVFGVMHNLRHGGLDAEIAAIAVDAGVVGKALGVAAEAELVVGLVEIAEAETSSASLLRSKPVRGTMLKTP